MHAVCIFLSIMNLKSRWPKNITDKKFPLFPKLIATSLGVGFLPWMPGTWGAILAIILWLPLYLYCQPTVIFVTTLLLAVIFTIAGTWASTESEKYWGKDPVVACIDETVGQWFTLLPLSAGVATIPWWEILIALALFRFFDIYKPLGIRQTESLPAGYGMMADDILAAIYSAAILLILNCFIL